MKTRFFDFNITKKMKANTYTFKVSEMLPWIWKTLLGICS